MVDPVFFIVSHSHIATTSNYEKVVAFIFIYSFILVSLNSKQILINFLISLCPHSFSILYIHV